jgi:hypothetical protein
LVVSPFAQHGEFQSYEVRTVNAAITVYVNEY